MIEVLFRDTGPAVVLGEAEDLEGISMLRLDRNTNEISMENTQAERTVLGQLTEATVAGLGNADAIIVAALFKNTLSWAVEVDLDDFQEAPRKVTEIELTALLQGMANTGYTGEAATETQDKPQRRQKKERQRRG